MIHLHNAAGETIREVERVLAEARRLNHQAFQQSGLNPLAKPFCPKGSEQPAGQDLQSACTSTEWGVWRKSFKATVLEESCACNAAKKVASSMQRAVARHARHGFLALSVGGTVADDEADLPSSDQQPLKKTPGRDSKNKSKKNPAKPARSAASGDDDDDALLEEAKAAAQAERADLERVAESQCQARVADAVANGHAGSVRDLEALIVEHKEVLAVCPSGRPLLVDFARRDLRRQNCRCKLRGEAFATCLCQTLLIGCKGCTHSVLGLGAAETRRHKAKLADTGEIGEMSC